MTVLLCQPGRPSQPSRRVRSTGGNRTRQKSVLYVLLLNGGAIVILIESQLVNKMLSRLPNERDEHFDVDGSYRQICALKEKGPAQQRLIDFIKQSLQYHQETQQQGSPDSKQGTSTPPSEKEPPPMYQTPPVSLTKAEVSRPDPQLPCYVTKSGVLVDDFVARDDVLQAIDDYFFGKSRSTSEAASQTRSFTLCGLGGIGKYIQNGDG